MPWPYSVFIYRQILVSSRSSDLQADMQDNAPLKGIISEADEIVVISSWRRIIMTTSYL